MPILPVHQAAAEFDRADPIDDLDASGATFPYLRLNEDEFERLCYAMFRKGHPLGKTKFWDEVSLLVRGSDAGRDLILLKDRRLAAIVQCKRLESRMSLPALLVEVAKTILFASVDPDTMSLKGMTYFLVVASDPAGTVVEFIARKKELIGSRHDTIRTAVDEALAQFKTLAGIDPVGAYDLVLATLDDLTLELVRPVDLDGRLADDEKLAGRFFRQRIVVDNDVVSAHNADMLAKLGELFQRTDSLPILTDDDLKIIKDRIEKTPQSHRVSLVMASLFGFPREMFTGTENLRRYAQPYLDLLMRIYDDYTYFAFEQTAMEARRICNSPEIIYLLNPAARDFPFQYLNSVASDCLAEAVTGKVMSEILDVARKNRRPVDEEDRIRIERGKLVERLHRYIAGDFSGVTGEGEALAQKHRVILQSITGIGSPAEIEGIVDEGIALLRPELALAATKLRGMLSEPISVFIGGLGAVDHKLSFLRAAETLGAKKTDLGPA